mgnify:CR=1 FL=1
MRTAEIQRDTKETQVFVAVNLDGTGQAILASGIPFLDHMLDQIARHGVVDLTVKAKGDLEIDAHHTVEDIGITLGQAVAKAVAREEALCLTCHDGSTGIFAASKYQSGLSADDALTASVTLLIAPATSVRQFFRMDHGRPYRSAAPSTLVVISCSKRGSL